MPMRRMATAVALATAGCLMLTGPAAAETVVITDPVRDFPAMAATDDIRRATISNNRAGLTFRVKLADLAPGASVVGLIVYPAGDSLSLKVRVRRYANGRVTNNWVANRGQFYWGGQCWELTSSWRPQKNVITVQLPWHCLRNIRADLRTDLSVSAFFRNGTGSAWQPVDQTEFAQVRYR